MEQCLDGQGVPARIESAVNGRRLGSGTVFPRHLVERLVGVLAGKEKPFPRTVQRAHQVLQNPLGGDPVRRLADYLEAFQVGHRQAGVADQHLLVVRHLPVPAHRVPEEPLVLPVIDAVPHPLERILDHPQDGPVARESVAGGEKPQRLPRRLLRFDSEASELLVVKLHQPGHHGAHRGIFAVAVWQCSAFRRNPGS